MAPLDAVQDETTPGAPAHGLGIGSSRLDGHSGPLAAFTRRGHGFLSDDGPLARQGIRTVTFVFRGRRVVINRMSPLDRLIHSPDHRRMAAICAFLPLHRDRGRAGIRPKLTYLQNTHPAAAPGVRRSSRFFRGRRGKGAAFLPLPACPNACRKGPKACDPERRLNALGFDPGGPLGVRSSDALYRGAAGNSSFVNVFLWFDGGSTRARTLDPLIKRNRVFSHTQRAAAVLLAKGST